MFRHERFEVGHDRAVLAEREPGRRASPPVRRRAAPRAVTHRLGPIRDRRTPRTAAPEKHERARSFASISAAGATSAAGTEPVRLEPPRVDGRFVDLQRVPGWAGDDARVRVQHLAQPADVALQHGTRDRRVDRLPRAPPRVDRSRRPHRAPRPASPGSDAASDHRSPPVRIRDGLRRCRERGMSSVSFILVQSCKPACNALATASWAIASPCKRSWKAAGARSTSRREPVVSRPHDRRQEPT